MKILRKLVLFVFLVAVLVGLAFLVPEKAEAWKTKTHGYSANILLNDAYDGYLYVDGANYAVPPEYLLALRSYPDAFRAGALGPDFYPDMLTGQSYIHPYDAKAGIGVGDWLNELVNTVNSLPRDSEARKEALAFTLGMAVHYAGDQFGHDFINAFAGGAYPAYSEAAQNIDKLYYIIRHMAEETYMDGQIGNRLGSTGVSAPEKFIVNTWIYNGTARNGPATIYSNYSSGMMYQYQYLVELRNKLYKFAEENRPSVTVPVPQIVQFCDRWIEDLDTATYQLIVTFDDIAHDFLTGANGKSDIQIVTDRLNTWLDSYGQYASPAPDIIIDLSRAIGKTQDWILEKIGLTYLKNAFNEFKTKIVKEAILWGLSQAGIDYKQYENLLKDPELALKANGGSEQDWLEYKAYMDAFKNNYESFDAFYNTVLMGKLILMGPDNLEDFFSSHGTAGLFYHSTGKVMTDEVEIEIHTKDGGIFDTYGTDDNVYLEVYENGSLVKSKLLDISNYNDFEMNSENGKYRVELGRPVYVGALSFKLNLKKAFGTGVDEWTPDAAWITCYRAGYVVQAKQKVLSSAHHFDEFNKPFQLSFTATGTLTYDSVLNLKIINYMLSNDNSTQWVNSRNSLWANSGARRKILYEVFHGFKPTITISATRTTFDVGSNVTLTANFQSYWNGITKERRDREYLVSSVNETKQQACNGTAYIYDISNGQQLLTTATVSNGVMTANLSSLSVGVHRLRVDYDGDDYNGSAKSNVLTVTVTHSYEVTFSVVNGKWNDGSYGDKTVFVSGTGDKLYLKSSQIPAVGNNPADGYKAGSWNVDVSENTPITGKTRFVYTYVEKTPISTTVTFRVVNGKWNSGSSEDIQVVINGLEGDQLKLKAEHIPAVGDLPDYPYKKGEWNNTPEAGMVVNGNPTFIYTYAKRSAISGCVTFRVENGAWNTGSREDLQLILDGYEGETLTFDESMIPEAGDFPDYPYKKGDWVVTPPAGEPVTGNPVYVYRYVMKDPISRTVTFKVEHGAWNSGSKENVVLTLEGYEGDILKFTADQIPLAGDNPDYPYKAGGWNVPPAADTEVTADLEFTYSYIMKDPISRTVTFKVEHGAWNNGSKDDVVLTLEGYEGDILKFTADQIPLAGDQADYPYKAGGWNEPPAADTEVTANLEYTYSYIMKDPISHTVTFKVENGAWNSGSRLNVVLTLEGYEGDILKFTADQIPSAGDKADYPYKAGGWNEPPAADTEVTADLEYIYSYIMKDPISQTVTFKVLNGAWNNGDKEDVIITLEGYEGDVLKLSADQIPAVGNMPDYPFKAGEWDATPQTDVEIKDNPVFTYGYVIKDELIRTVTFKVVNGAWNDGSKEDVTVTLEGYEGDMFTLDPSKIPAVGEMPDYGFMKGEWEVVPDTENPFAVDLVYTYKYFEIPTFEVVFETNGGSEIAPVTVFTGEAVDAPEDPERKGFVFAGWFADEALKTPYDFSNKIEADTVIYAAWEAVTYTGDGAKQITEGVPGDVVITVNRSHADETCFAHFTGVKIDGKELENGKDYTAAAGSTVVTLKSDALVNLSVGDHTVTVMFDDGEAEVLLTVVPKVIIPPTGDAGFVAIVLAGIAVLLCAAFVSVYLRKREGV